MDLRTFEKKAVDILIKNKLKNSPEKIEQALTFANSREPEEIIGVSDLKGFIVYELFEILDNDSAYEFSSQIEDKENGNENLLDFLDSCLSRKPGNEFSVHFYSRLKCEPDLKVLLDLVQLSKF